MPMTVRRFLSLPVRVSDAEARAVLDRTGVPGRATPDRRAVGRAVPARAAGAGAAEPAATAGAGRADAGLDQPGIIAFYKLIEEVRRQTGVAVLMVSHDLLVVMRASDRVVCLNGHVCCEGTRGGQRRARLSRAFRQRGRRARWRFTSITTITTTTMSPNMSMDPTAAIPPPSPGRDDHA